MRRRRLLYASVGLLAAGFVGLNILAYRHAYAMMHFTAAGNRTGEPETLPMGQKAKVLCCGVRIPRPRTSLSPASLGSECKSLTLTVTNGITLGAWYCPAAAPGTQIILFHGYTGEKTGTLAEAKAFLELGASVLLVDFRGSGDSSESYTTLGYEEAEDVAAAVRYAQEHLTPSKVILYGQSMGAAAVLRAVHSCGVRPDAIIVEAVFDTMLHTVRHRFQAMGVPSFPSAELLVFWGGRQAGFNGFGHNPAAYAASVKCPILFLHGAEDQRAHIEEGRRVFAAVPGLKRFQEVHALGHESVVVRYPQEWKQAVGQFLRAAQ